MPLPINSASGVTAPTASTPATPPAMLHLSSREVPPGGLAYKIIALAERAPKECWVSGFNAVEDLAKEVNKREFANRIPPSTIAEIENQICQRLPPGYCRDQHERRTTGPGAMALSLSDVITGTIGLLRWFFHGSVPDEQIIARTYVCNKCPKNLPVKGCEGCAGNVLRSLINKIVTRRLSSDAVLGACEACNCSLPAKTRFKLEDVLKSLDAPKRAKLWEDCWILREENGQTLRNDPRT